jgi:hypothetical protein
MGMLMKTSVDIDLISVLFKYHFSTPTIPNQFSETFNAAVHAGVRKDFFHFRNHRTPLQTNLQHMNHFEIDGGVFAGLGTTLINPSVTENNLAVEYDGLVLQKGVAAFIGVQNFTIGVGWGSDQLLDKNHTYWIYSGKTWLGVIIGLKLSK